MKRTLLISILFTITLITRALNDSINFSNKTIPELIKNVQDFDKLIFIDITATWCNSCEKMEQTTFQDKDVVDFFSANFLSKKIYIDRDSIQSDSISMFLSNQTQAVPTYYFLDKNGKILTNSIGYKSPQELMMLGEKAKEMISPEYEIAQMEKTYSKNMKENVFLLKYMKLKNKIGLKGDKALNDYLKLIPEDKYASDTVIYAIINNEISIYGKGYKLLTDENYQQLAKSNSSSKGNTSIGYDMYNSALNIIMINIDLAIKSEDENLLNDGIFELNKVMQNKDKAKELTERMRILFNNKRIKSTANTR